MLPEAGTTEGFIAVPERAGNEAGPRTAAGTAEAENPSTPLNTFPQERKTTMNTYVILRRNGWPTPQALEEAASCSAKVGAEEMADQVRWIRSYVVGENDGGLGTVCIYEGVDEEAVREHARRAGLPADEVLPLRDLVVVNEDPMKTGK